MTDPSASQAAIGTLRHVIDTIGSAMLLVLAAPRGLERPVVAATLHDPMDVLPYGPDQMLLLTGLRADDPRAIDLTREAADKGYAAIVVKRRGHDLTSLVSAASTAQIAVVAAADLLAWRQLDALLFSVLGSGGVGTGRPSGGGDELFALANAIAAQLGGSVAIEDLERQVLAYSSVPGQRIDALRQQGILDRRVPDMQRNLWQYQKVFAVDGVVRFPGDSDELPRSAIAIRAGSRPMGTIWGIEGNGGLSPEGEAALVEGARLAAMNVLRAQEATALEQQVREGALRAALEGSLGASETSFQLSLTAGSELTLVGLAPRTATGQAAPLLVQLGSAVARYTTAFRPDSFVTTTSHVVYVLLPHTAVAAAGRLASDVLSTLNRTFPGEVRAAAAPVPTAPLQLTASRQEIEDILRVSTGARTGLRTPRVAQLADVHTGVLLNQVDDLLERETRLRQPAIARMLAHDTRHRTAYAASVLAWLESGSDIRLAAEGLGIHPNTLRYRIRRVEELSGLRLEDPDERLAVWLQLRLPPAPQPSTA